MENLSPEAKANKIRYINRYNKTHVIQFMVRFRKGRDDKAIEYMRQQKNKTGYIRELMAADMKQKGLI
jgi:hypothetical protein